jgi:predicted RNA binding protein YcfA (HicA-like mRNA interferase family)
MTGRMPTLTARQVIRALERGGFVLVRVTGSHHLYEHPETGSCQCRSTPVISSIHS